jgi:hypothetical protein
VGQAVYVAGGMVGETGRPLATFQRFDAQENRWTTLERLPAPVRAAAAAAVGRTIYVIGGSTPEGSGGQVYAYDIDGASWREVAPLPEPRFNHAAVTIGNLVVVLGGFVEGEEHRDVFVYDPRLDRWRRGPRLPRAMHAFDAVDFDGDLWVIGGRRGEEVLRDVWVLDPGDGRWRPGPPLPRAMELLGAAVVGDEIHAVWESVYQVYDAATGSWRQEPSPQVTRHALQLFNVDGTIYAIGGCTTALRDSPVVERRRVA